MTRAPVAEVESPVSMRSAAVAAFVPLAPTMSLRKDPLSWSMERSSELPQVWGTSSGELTTLEPRTARMVAPVLFRNSTSVAAVSVPSWRTMEPVARVLSIVKSPLGTVILTLVPSDSITASCPDPTAKPTPSGTSTFAPAVDSVITSALSPAAPKSDTAAAASAVQAVPPFAVT